MAKSKLTIDFKDYIEERKRKDSEFAEGYEEGYRNFKIGILLKIAREESGMTQSQIAKKLKTNKSAISRIENHAEDIRLSTLQKYAKALGKDVSVKIA